MHVCQKPTSDELVVLGAQKSKGSGAGGPCRLRMRPYIAATGLLQQQRQRNFHTELVAVQERISSRGEKSFSYRGFRVEG